MSEVTLYSSWCEPFIRMDRDVLVYSYCHSRLQRDYVKMLFLGRFYDFN